MANNLDLPSGHIVLPFDLHQAPKKFNAAENSKLLFDVFPGTQRVDFDERILVYYFNQLPPKPWPRKIAGVPCYLTTDPTDQGPTLPIDHQSRSRIALSDHLDLRDNETAVDLIFDLVRDFFERADISITEILFWGHILVIVLEDDSGKADILKSLPRSVAHCNCFYLFDSDMARPRSLAGVRLEQISEDDQVDDSQSDTTLCSGEQSQKEGEMLTPSDVLVKDHLGHKYMTVSGSPGFCVNEEIHYPNSSARPNPLPKFTGFARAAETRLGEDIFLGNPFSGIIEGTRGPHSLLRVPSDDPLLPEDIRLRCQWDYMGQNSSRVMVDGAYGSAISDSHQGVLGFFRYSPNSGVLRNWCLSIAGDYLLDMEYSIV